MADENPPRAPTTSIFDAVRARAREAVAFDRREVAAIAGLVLLVLAGAGIAYVRARPATAAPILAPTLVATTPPVGERISVHVAGAVKRPGVYRFEPGARVIHAIRRAGGFRRRADTAALNLARVLADGEQIVVPRRSGGAGSSNTSSTASGLLNINLASAAELEALPGIGPVLAQRIVDHRTTDGPFATVQDLLAVSGIGPKTFAAIESLITV